MRCFLCCATSQRPHVLPPHMFGQPRAADYYQLISPLPPFPVALAFLLRMAGRLATPPAAPPADPPSPPPPPPLTLPPPRRARRYTYLPKLPVIEAAVRHLRRHPPLTTAMKARAGDHALRTPANGDGRRSTRSLQLPCQAVDQQNPAAPAMNAWTRRSSPGLVVAHTYWRAGTAGRGSTPLAGAQRAERALSRPS